MADISGLNLLPAEALNLDDYAAVGGARKFPEKGQYTLRAPDSFPAEAFAPNKAGTALTVQIDPTIVGPTGEGRVLKYTRVSGKAFQRNGKSVSQLGDYLKACGVTGTFGDWQSQADAAEMTAGQVYEAVLDWRLFARGAGPNGSDLIIDGMEQFPSDGKGGYLPYVEHPTEVTENGEKKRLWANLQIVRFIPRG